MHRKKLGENVALSRTTPTGVTIFTSKRYYYMVNNQT